MPPEQSRIKNPLMADLEYAMSKALETRQARTKGKATTAEVNETEKTMYDALEVVTWFWVRPREKSIIDQSSDKAYFFDCYREAVTQYLEGGSNNPGARRKAEWALYNLVKASNPKHPWLAYMEEHGTAIIPKNKARHSSEQPTNLTDNPSLYLESFLRARNRAWGC